MTEAGAPARGSRTRAASSMPSGRESSPTRSACARRPHHLDRRSRRCATPSTSSSTRRKTRSRWRLSATAQPRHRDREAPRRGPRRRASRMPASTASRICNNTCFFCFLKGNPKGMRKTLYVKDDDYRLSFFHGNFVTLTNLDEDDWQRLEEQRLSPLNVSVHATEPELRRYLLGNKHAPDICEQLRRLGDDGYRGEHAGRPVPGRQRRRGARPHDRAISRALCPTVQNDLHRPGRRDEDRRGAHRARRARRRRSRAVRRSTHARSSRRSAAVPAALPRGARARRSCISPTSTT